jgi:hypothetical protein
MVNASDIKNKLNGIIQNPNFMKEYFISTIIIMMTILVIVLALLYFYYVKNLMPKECSVMEKKYGTINGKIKSINSRDPKCGYTLKDYYIKSAYNCCSGGSYKHDFVNLCNLKNVLKQGVRGLDFEVYLVDGKPVVATSTQDSVYIKETFNSVNFADVMKTINSYAFSGGTCPNPTDPIIIHLRIKSNHQKTYSTKYK